MDKNWWQKKSSLEKFLLAITGVGLLMGLANLFKGGGMRGIVSPVIKMVIWIPVTIILVLTFILAYFTLLLYIALVRFTNFLIQTQFIYFVMFAIPIIVGAVYILLNYKKHVAIIRAHRKWENSGRRTISMEDLVRRRKAGDTKPLLGIPRRY